MSSMVASAMAIYNNLQSKGGQGFPPQPSPSSSIPKIEPISIKPTDKKPHIDVPNIKKPLSGKDTS